MTRFIAKPIINLVTSKVPLKCLKIQPQSSSIDLLQDARAAWHPIFGMSAEIHNQKKLLFIIPKIALISVFLPRRWQCKDFFIEISSYSDDLISIAFFPWQGVDPTIVLHLKKGPHGTHH